MILITKAIFKFSVAFFVFAAVTFFGFSSKIMPIESAQAQTINHPFMIVKESEYPALRAKASQEPWKTMKAQAVNTINNEVYVLYDPVIDLTRGYRMGYKLSQIVSAGSLAYILETDSVKKNAYKIKIVNTIKIGWDDIYNNVRPVDGYGWKVAGSDAMFSSVLAVDILYNDLTPAELSAVEIRLNRTANVYCPGYDEYTYGGCGMWAIYKGDRPLIDQTKNKWKENYLALLSSDGVFKDGPGYAFASIDQNRLSKMAFLHILEYTGEDNSYYTNPRVIGFYEWLVGGASTPFLENFTFGDSGLNEHDSIGTGMNWYAGLFSAKAGRYGAWYHQGITSPVGPKYGGDPLNSGGNLLNYVLIKSLSTPEQPKSDIWPDGSAVFWDNTVSDKALNGAIWNLKSTDGSNGHPHKDTNAIHLAAYGEHVLRNSGYLGWGRGALGFSWDYIHSTAVSNNTVLINGMNHQNFYGSGITEGFTSNLFDYASGDSGNALPNGKHYRNFVFIQPQDEKNGYWILYDEVKARTAGDSVNVVLHPNSNDDTRITANQEYKWKIGPSKDSTQDVFISIFLGTNPNSVSIRDGLLADWQSKSFVGKYLYSSYPTDSSGKKNIVTVLFPSDATHAKATMLRISNPGYTGASIAQGATVDYALESSGSNPLTYNGTTFQGTAVWYRQNSGTNGGYFVRQGRSFKDGSYGFDSNAALSIHMKDKYGMVVSSGTSVRFFYPSISEVYIDGIKVTPTASNPGISMTVNVPSGTHSIGFAPGGPVIIPTPPTPPTPDTIDPAITITCPVNSATPPATPPTYSSNTISVSGTASDNIGVSKVEVKVGPAGAYQTATGTTSWSISGVTLVAGLNTVYAKVTDTASPPNTKEVFIQVMYDPTIPAPPTGGNFSINPTTHAVQQNGTDVFPMGMFEISSYWVDYWGPTTQDAINSLTNFDYSENGTGFGPSGLGAHLWQTSVVPFYEANSVWYDTPARAYNQAALLPYSTSNNFFGFYLDETDVHPADSARWAQSQAIYPLVKAKFPNKLVLSTYWGDFQRLSTVSDVIQYDAFRHASHHPSWYEATLEEYIFAAEAMLNQGMIANRSGATSLNSFPNKSIWIMWVAVGSQWKEGGSYTWEPVTAQEMRVEAYWTITTDAKGLGYWTYRLNDWANGKIRPESLSNYPIQTALYNNLAGEIKSLEPIILLPTIAHSWGGPSQGVQNTRVTFSPNPIRNMKTWDYDLNYLSYNLKRSGDTYYLFVANKDSADLNNVVINITGLTGPMTAKVLGSSTLSYDAAGRTIPVTDGKFTDNFQGFAGRVYQIYSGPTAPPLPAGGGANPPTCTAPSATIPPTTPITPPPPPVVCGDSVDGKCPDGCTYLEDIDCPLPFVPDTTPPTVPQKLTATGSITVPAIDLKWRASIDDKGVTGYNIYRDGIKIAAVNRVSYTDTNVIFGETHIYTVTAFDLAGNESAQSNPATAMSAPLNVGFMKSVSASGLSQLVGNFLKWILTVAGSLALLIIITGGVMYASSTGNEQRVILSKKIVLGAIGGLILILIAYSIVTLLGRIV